MEIAITLPTLSHLVCNEWYPDVEWEVVDGKTDIWVILFTDWGVDPGIKFGYTI